MHLDARGVEVRLIRAAHPPQDPIVEAPHQALEGLHQIGDALGLGLLGAIGRQIQIAAERSQPGRREHIAQHPRQLLLGLAERHQVIAPVLVGRGAHVARPRLDRLDEHRLARVLPRDEIGAAGFDVLPDLEHRALPRLARGVEPAQLDDALGRLDQVGPRRRPDDALHFPLRHDRLPKPILPPPARRTPSPAPGIGGPNKVASRPERD